MDDDAIIELFFARSEQALRELDGKYGKVCHSLSYNILHSRQDAEECVNDAYLGTWNAIPPARPNPLLAFLCRIVRNLSLMRYHGDRAAKRGGGSYTVEWAPAPGYRVVKVIIDGGERPDLLGASSWTFEDIGEDHAIQIVLEPIPGAVPDDPADPDDGSGSGSGNDGDGGPDGDGDDDATKIRLKLAQTGDEGTATAAVALLAALTAAGAAWIARRYAKIGR